MPTLSPEVGLSLNFLIPLVIGGFLGRLHALAMAQAKTSSDSVASLVVKTVNTTVDPSLRGFVLAELQNLLANVEQNSQTVMQTSLQVLEKALPSIPTATLTQVSQIVSEFVLTFESGLASSFGAAASAGIGPSLPLIAPASATNVTSTTSVTTIPINPKAS